MEDHFAPAPPAPPVAKHPVNKALEAIHDALDFILRPMEATFFPVLEADVVQLGATLVKRYIPDTNVQHLIISLFQTSLPNAHLNAVAQLDDHAIGVAQFAKAVIPPRVSITEKQNVDTPAQAVAPSPKVVALRPDAPS